MPRANLPPGYTACPFHDVAHRIGHGCPDCADRDARSAAAAPPPGADTGAATRVAPRPTPAPALADYAAAKAAAVNDAVDHPAATLREYARVTDEMALQRDAEKWLEWQGYWRLDEKHIVAGGPPRGWYGHLPRNKTKGSIILPDLPIWANGWRRCLALELKRADGQPNANQRPFVERGEWPVCRSLVQVKVEVLAWEMDVSPETWAAGASMSQDAATRTLAAEWEAEIGRGERPPHNAGRVTMPRLIDGHTYQIRHERFGHCEAKVLRHDSEWADLLITKGRLVGKCDVWDEGEKKTVRLSRFRFTPLAPTTGAPAPQPGAPAAKPQGETR